MPGNAVGAITYRDLYAKAYETWRAVWGAELRRLGRTEALASDAFTRADVVATVAAGDEVIGVHLYCFYDLGLAAYREHSFLASNFGPGLLSRARDSGLEIVMTLEQLTVASEWRRSNGGVPLGHALSALGLEAFGRSGADGVLISTRNSRRVDEIARQIGFEAAGKTIVHGEESDLMTFRAPSPRRTFEDPRLESLVRELWRGRTDFTARDWIERVAAA